MCSGRKFQEDQALRSLLVIDDELMQPFRYPLQELGDDSDFMPSTAANTIAYHQKRKIKGKENKRERKYLLPQIKSSKDQLKQQLQKLEGKDISRQNQCSILEALLKSEPKTNLTKKSEQSYFISKDLSQCKIQIEGPPKISIVSITPLGNYKKQNKNENFCSKEELPRRSKKAMLGSQSLASKTLLILNEINSKKSRSIFDSCLKKKQAHSYSQAIKKKTKAFLDSMK